MKEKRTCMGDGTKVTGKKKKRKPVDAAAAEA